MDIVKRLQYWAFKFCGKGEREDIASDAMTDGWQEIERLREWNSEIGINAKFFASEVERLREALATINAWYPISVSRPMDTVRDIMDFANKTLNGEKK